MLLGLLDFVVVSAGVVVGTKVDEVELLVQTTGTTTGCPRCAVVATLHDRKPRWVWVRDLPSRGRPVVLVWLKRLWQWEEPCCEQRTWSETSPAIRRQAMLTERARAEACRRVGSDRQRLRRLDPRTGPAVAG